MLVTGVTPLMGFPRRGGRQLSWQLLDFTLEGWGQAVHAFALKPKQWQKAGLDRECKKWCWNSVRTSHTVDRAVHHFKHVICISLLHVCNNPRRVFFPTYKWESEAPRGWGLCPGLQSWKVAALRTGSLFNHSAHPSLHLVGKRPRSEVRYVPAHEPCNPGQMISLLEPQFAHLQNGCELWHANHTGLLEGWTNLTVHMAYDKSFSNIWGEWQATVQRVTQSWTQLKQLSMHALFVNMIHWIPFQQNLLYYTFSRLSQ